MSAQRQEAVKRLTAPDVAARKGKTPVVCLTAYTAPMAEILIATCCWSATRSAWWCTACPIRWA
jgi:hypothetical protein